MTHRTSNRRFALALAIVCALASLCGANKPVNRIETTADEYAVFSAAMEEVVGGGPYVVLDTTTIHRKIENLGNTLAFPGEDAKLLTDDLLSDFRTANQQHHVIAPHFPEGIRVKLISERERSAMFTGCIGAVTCGWKTFYEKYPGAPGITSLSRVGFNSARTRALVYVGNVRDWEVGGGMYLLLTKTNEEWRVTSKARGWMS